MTAIALALMASSFVDDHAAPCLTSLKPSQFKAVKSTTGELEWVLDVKFDDKVDQIVVSLQIKTVKLAGVEVLIQPVVAGSKPYSLGKFQVGGTRTSVNGQDDALAKVATDTLILKAPSDRFRVTLKPIRDEKGNLPTVEALRISAVDSHFVAEQRLPDKSAWGHVLEPPRRSQMSYANPLKICSPTSVSMVLGYWAEKLHQPAIDATVPEVVDGVFDPAWPGTGNWAFNVAYAAAKPGMTAYVSRFRDIRDLEAWTKLGVPVICSVNIFKLHAIEPKPGTDPGHLVVLVGFTPEGDPVFNDPGRSVVRMIYKRADFDEAWATSYRTVYLIYPRQHSIPSEPGPWDARPF